MHAISYGPTNHYPPCLLAAVLFLGGYSDCRPTYASIFSEFCFNFQRYTEYKKKDRAFTI